MIHRFCVRNFQSIRDEVELDFRIPSTTPSLPRFRESRSRPDVRLPSVVVLVGPNGAGKTALLRAMTATVDFVVHSIGLDSSDPIPYFLPFLSPSARTGPTRIEVEFDSGWLSSEPGQPDLRCRYTLELRRERSDLHPLRVSYEALHTFPRNRPRRILERREHGPVYVARELKIRRSDSRLGSVPTNASVISTFAKFEMEPFSSIAADFMSVQRNIAGPDSLRPSTDVVTRFYRDNPELVDRLSDRLQRSDLGIERMRLERLPDGQWILVFDHQGLDMPVNLSNESTGTRHLVHVFPQLDMVLQTGHVAIMDALDSELHTELVGEVLRWFQRPETNPNGAQLICSLHNVSVLDELDKEEVFIVEKSRDGATLAHGARQVAGLRRTENLQKLYRSGALGGLPIFG